MELMKCLLKLKKGMGKKFFFLKNEVPYFLTIKNIAKELDMMAHGRITSTQEGEAGTTCGRANLDYTKCLKPSWTV